MSDYLVRNRAAIMHEVQTPMRGHDASCCIDAIARAEADALAAHQAGTCHESEWSCSHCEAE